MRRQACLLAVLLLLGVVVSQVPTVDFTVDLTQPTTPFNHVWEECVGSGHATLALRQDYRNYLTQCAEELGFKYVRFHGTFDDDMSTYTTINGQPMYSFYNVDSIYDFLLSINMKPYIEMSFMPELLASGTTTVFHYEGNITPPANSTAWADFVTTFATHLVDRYGLDEVRTWPFEVWNEPNCGFWTGTQQDYYDLYQVTANALKAVDPLLRVGGPATCQSQWITDFLSWTASNNVPVDFISTHEYPTDIVPTYRDVMQDVVKQTRDEVGPDMPLYYSEYNDGLYSPPHHDESYAAAFIAHNAHDMQPYVNLMSWWTFSDIFEEQGFSPIVFNDPNGWGLLNRYGIAKPSYRAFQLLHQMGTQEVSVDASNEGATGSIQDIEVWATLTDTEANGQLLQLVVYNFDVIDSAMEKLVANITIQGVNFNTLAPAATLNLIDDNHVNPVAAWEALGSPMYPTQNQLEILDIASQLKPEALTYTKVGSSAINIQLELVPWGVGFISLQIA